MSCISIKEKRNPTFSGDALQFLIEIHSTVFPPMNIII